MPTIKYHDSMTVGDFGSRSVNCSGELELGITPAGDGASAL